MDEERYNPFSEPPLCRASEVITEHELHCMYANISKAYKNHSWFSFRMKLQLLGACAMVEGLIDWIEKGKP